jgi:biotin carboxyl carrier protein
MKFAVTVEGERVPVEVTGSDGRYRVVVGDQEWQVDGRIGAQGIGSLLIDGVSHVAAVTDRDGACAVEIAGARYLIEVEEATRQLIRTRSGAARGDGARTVRAPMPGRITLVRVAAGQRVGPGDTLVVVEAMKMENELKATGAGVVREVRVQAGQPVNAGDVLVVLE